MMEYLKGTSDFSFELQTLKLIRESGLDCEHGGIYEDPVSKKSREFDIRALARRGRYSIRLAVECKNVRENFPLLVSRVPRHESESFHEVVLAGDNDNSDIVTIDAFKSKAKVLRICGMDSRYKPNDPVGKSIAQVGRANDKSAEIVANDSEVFDKWGQCLSSANDLVSDSYWSEVQEQDLPRLAAVIPILVVPNGRLWHADYSIDGLLQTEPELAEHCTVLINKSYDMGGVVPLTYRISHLEIFTSAELLSFIKNSLRGETEMQEIFPNTGVWNAMHRDDA